MKIVLFSLLILLLAGTTHAQTCTNEELASISSGLGELKALEMDRIKKISKNSNGTFDLPSIPAPEANSKAVLDKKLEACATLGHPWAQYLMGVDTASWAEQQETVHKSLIKSNEENRLRIDPVMQVQLAGLKQASFNTYRVAFEWFTKSAKSGFAPSMEELAKLYRDGKGTEKSIFLSVTWFDRAARTFYQQNGEYTKPTITRLLEEMTKISPNHPLTIRLTEELYSSDKFEVKPTNSPWDVVSISTTQTATPSQIETINGSNTISPTSVILNAHALVIGNGAYSGSARLTNPINDSRLIAEKLRSMGFTVTELTNLNRASMVSALSQFNRKAVKADLSLLFYAGHGVQISGTNYLLPIDINLSDLDQVPLFGVPLTSVLEQYLPGKIKLVFLDACRENPLLASNTRGFTRGLAPMNVSKGTLISYSTKDGQVALDGDGQKNSPFTSALLQHLDDPQDIAVILRKVREEVMASTKGKQEPWEYGSLIYQFVG